MADRTREYQLETGARLLELVLDYCQREGLVLPRGLYDLAQDWAQQARRPWDERKAVLARVELERHEHRKGQARARPAVEDIADQLTALLVEHDAIEHQLAPVLQTLVAVAETLKLHSSGVSALTATVEQHGKTLQIARKGLEEVRRA